MRSRAPADIIVARSFLQRVARIASSYSVAASISVWQSTRIFLALCYASEYARESFSRNRAAAENVIRAKNNENVIHVLIQTNKKLDETYKEKLPFAQICLNDKYSQAANYFFRLISENREKNIILIPVFFIEMIL